MNDKVTLVENIYGAFGRGDVAAVMEQLHADVEWVTPDQLPWSKGRYKSRSGVAEYFESFGAALVDPTIMPEEWLACPDRVVVLGRERSAARTTGRRFEARFAHIWSIEDRKVVRFEGIIDTAAVIAAFAG